MPALHLLRWWGLRSCGLAQNTGADPNLGIVTLERSRSYLTPEIVVIASCLTRYVAARQAFFSSLMVRVILSAQVAPRVTTSARQTNDTVALSVPRGLEQRSMRTG